MKCFYLRVTLMVVLLSTIVMVAGGTALAVEEPIGTSDIVKPTTIYVEAPNDTAGTIAIIVTATCTIIYTAITLIIFCQNKKVQEENLKAQLFKKRFAVYTKLKEAIHEYLLLQHGDDPTSEFIKVFREIREELALLFDEDIHDYAMRVLRKAEILGSLKAQERDEQNSGENYTKNKELQRITEEIGVIEKWFEKQTMAGEMREAFKRYIDLGSYGLKKG